MRRLTTGFTLAALLTALCLHAQAAELAPTKIKFASIHCKGCAKRLATRLKEVSGVAKVETDQPNATATVTPAPEKTLSPKALWEAAEKAKQKPVKLEGPSGTFTAKPQT
jgi:Cu+-exporting ATPase